MEILKLENIGLIDNNFNDLFDKIRTNEQIRKKLKIFSVKNNKISYIDYKRGYADNILSSMIFTNLEILDMSYNKLYLFIINTILNNFSIWSEKKIIDYYQDEDTLFVEDPDNDSYRNIKTSYKPLNKERPHSDLHSSRVLLMFKAIKKFYGINKIQNIPEQVFSISESAGLTEKLFVNKKLKINQALTNDVNDQIRIKKLYIKLMSLVVCNYDKIHFQDILDLVCHCYLNKKECEHMTNVKTILAPHCLYYLEEELINDILIKQKNIIFTSHIFSGKNGTVENKNNKKIIEWNSNGDYVNFKVLDDKKYIHKLIFNYLNKTSNFSGVGFNVTVSNRIYYQNMQHISGIIYSDFFHTPEFIFNVKFFNTISVSGLYLTL